MRKLSLILLGLLLVSCNPVPGNLKPSVSITMQTTQEEVHRGLFTCTLRAEYPEISGMDDSALQEDINALIREAVVSGSFNGEACLNGMAEIMEEGSAASDTTQINSIVTLNRSDLLSLRFAASQYLEGAAHPNNTNDALTIDLRTGRVIPLDRLFHDHADFRVILEDAVTKAANMEGIEYGIADPLRLRPQSYYLTSENLVLINLFDVHALKGFEVEIPLEDLSELLDPESPVMRLIPQK